jgi:uncharacterized protein RhaS with RHS repeats
VNLYGYVENDPINFIDPLGLSSIQAQVLVAIAKGDLVALESLLATGMLSPAAAARVQEAINRLNSPAVQSGLDKACKAKAAVDKIRNILKNHLKPGSKGDISGTVGDMVGRPIPKPGGGMFDHIKEMQDTLRGLRKHMDTLKNFKDPAGRQALKDAEDAVKAIEDAIKGAGI